MPGIPGFGTGQPTLTGFDKVLEPILKKYGDEKIIYWANLRQEPVVYVNGKPYTARDPEKYATNISVIKEDIGVTEKLDISRADVKINC